MFDLSAYGDQLVDAVIDAVCMEAHGSAAATTPQTVTGLLPDAPAAALMKKAGVDRLGALQLVIELVRRGRTTPAPASTAEAPPAWAAQAVESYSPSRTFRR